ncbi:hypothetical protein [Komagataeibacter swingsii]|uniref:hypothetical protein n=1 Tax=Komagataeibacter swingsii TaxID=215220 RepID=UPI001C400591|nr:hypothetical protein [Komagataeibacter swingsii]
MAGHLLSAPDPATGLNATASVDGHGLCSGSGMRRDGQRDGALGRPRDRAWFDFRPVS